MTREQSVQRAGSRSHTRTCATRRARLGAPSSGGKKRGRAAPAEPSRKVARAGPKHFVERGDITDDVVVNPSDGSCAQQ